MQVTNNSLLKNSKEAADAIIFFYLFMAHLFVPRFANKINLWLGD